MLWWEVLKVSTLAEDDPVNQGYGQAGQLTFRPESLGLYAARRSMWQLARELELGADETMDLVMAVGEAISNAFLYGSPDKTTNLIYLGWHFAGDMLTVTVKDCGPGFKHYTIEPGHDDSTKFRGNGISLMHQCVDCVHFDLDDGTTVVLKKRTRSRQMQEA